MKVPLPQNFDFEGLKHHLANAFPNYNFWELPKNQILIEKNKIVGCYLIPHKNKLQIICGFSDIRVNIASLFFTIIGGIIIPIILYYLVFYKFHKRFERRILQEIQNYIIIKH